MKWIGEQKPSHSHGVQILEMGAELLLMGKKLDEIMFKEENAKNLLKKLRMLRQPESSQRDQHKEEIIKKLPWPTGIKGTWLRQNDRSGLEIRFQSFSFKELDQKIKSLQSISENLQKENK